MLILTKALNKAFRYGYFCIAFYALSSCTGAEEPIAPILSPKYPSRVLGYTDKTSYAPGEKVKGFVNAFENYDRGIIRLYDVNGNQVGQVDALLRDQVVANPEPWKNGLGYTLSFEYTVPLSLKSGLYFWENEIPMVVKSAWPGKAVIVYPSNTINAYTKTQSMNLYSPTVAQVSFQRPQHISMGSVLPFFKWIEGIPLTEWSYVSDQDLDDYRYLSGAHLLVIAGHSEYWTRKARNNFDAFVNQGGNAMVLSGNTMWWQVRVENNVLVCYKNMVDPVQDPSLQTKLWTDPGLNYPILSSIGADFDHGGYGLKVDRGWNGYKVTNPTSPLLAGLGLKQGDIVPLPTGEYDGAPLGGFLADGTPLIDNNALGFHRVELIGYDLGFRVVETVGTFIVFQKTPASGIVANVGSNHWCSEYGIGAFDGKVKLITLNMLDRMLFDKPLFTP